MLRSGRLHVFALALSACFGFTAAGLPCVAVCAAARGAAASSLPRAGTEPCHDRCHADSDHGNGTDAERCAHTDPDRAAGDSDHGSSTDPDHCPSSLCSQEPASAVTPIMVDAAPTAAAMCVAAMPRATWNVIVDPGIRLEPPAASHSPPIPPAFSILRP